MKRNIFDEEHNIFRESFRNFLKKEVVPYQEQWEEDGILPREIWQKCGEQGFLVPIADEKYGGLGQNDFRFDAIMIEELCYIYETGLMLSLHNSICAPYIVSYASDPLKERIMPEIVSGRGIMAIAMTEPGAGSDLAAMKTTAVEQDDHWVLNGSKTFISNGITSDYVIVAAKTDPKIPHCVGLFLVERDMAGFERGRKLKKMGLRSQDTAELFFKDVKVPKENVLGDPKMGFRYMMEKLGIERLTLAVGSVATAKAALDTTISYVKERQLFGKPLSAMQNTRFKLAEIQTEVEIGQVYVDRLIDEYNNGKISIQTICGAKFWTTDLACRVADECLQLHGGYGYMLEYPICRIYADARIGKIYAGANEVMKTVVAKEMGL
ncbi:MAG: acyl-CoA dehydrogenase family protein [Oligoflexus sp.]